MVVSGLVLLSLAVWVDRRREAPALRPFVIFVAVVGTLAVIDGLAAGNLTSLSIVRVTAFLAIPCTFTWFVAEYYGLPHLASPARKVAFLAPAVAGVVYYAGGVMLAGVALLTRTVGSYEHLDSRLGVTLSFVAIWPWTAYFTTPWLAGTLPLDTIISATAGGYVASAAAVGFGVTRGGLFEAAPAAGTLGPKTVFSDLEDPIVVVDHDQRVVSLNRAAADTFGTDIESTAGQPLSTCVGTDIDTLERPEAVELSVPEGTRHFEASVSPVRDRYDREPGHAIVITDVTRERVRSQRPAVLNRVLRHNLGNKMTNIMGRAEIIADSDNEHADSAETIVASANDLMSLSKGARQVEEMLSTAPDVAEDFALADFVTGVTEGYRTDHPEASLSVDIDDSLTVTTDSKTLSGVLSNLVENALVHNDAPTPVVTISARRTDNGVHLSVSDNGPGLPEHERAVLEAGDETALEHGSGLGLWAVKWGVVGLGGELEFSENKPDGTVVTIELSDAPASESTPPATVEAD